MTGRLRLRARYRRWVMRYRAYARMRGFRMEFNGPAYHVRGFLLCWAEPGFHRFWQVWTPGIAYFTWRLYRRLGRSRLFGLVIAGFDIGFRLNRLLM